MIMKLLTFAAISLGISGLLALGLILSQRPITLTGTDGLDFTQTLKQGALSMPELEGIEMRDGYALQVRRYEAGIEGAPLVVMVHGSAWHGRQFNGLANGLKVAADVVAVDLRGHGTQPGRRGDIDYIGQFEDDLADLITAQAKAGQKVVLLGHSSGGGLVVRMAGGAHGHMIDHAVLMAPFLSHKAPTTRENSGGWAHVMLRRIIGLSMLNSVRITALNGLEIIQFNMPRAVTEGPLGETATTSYSYRLNTSFAPRGDYLSDVAKLPDFTLVVGSEDEAFVAEGFAPLMSGVTDRGRYVIIPKVGHLDIVDAPEALTTILEGLNGL